MKQRKIVMKLTKGKIIAAIAIVVVLIGAFWWGGSAPGLQGFDVNPNNDVIASTDVDQNLEDSDTESESEADEKIEEDVQPTEGFESRPGGLEGGLTAAEKIDLAIEMAGGSKQQSGSVSYSESQGMVIDKSTGKDKYLTNPVPEGKPIPVEPQNAVITDKQLTCTLSIECSTILDNMDWLDPEKVELVPENGVIMAKKTVTFYEGESVFNVLLRECKKNKIHMEYMNTPMYNSAYIEGIHNLYEFDCGELSGWMYSVNGWYPNYGCSRYQLKQGDVVEWRYTCNLGIDIGGFNAIME